MFRVYDANDDGYVDFVEFMVNTFICICHCICVVYDGHADFVYLSDGITMMGLCVQMIYYIMSDGSPEEVLAKIFRVFDVNRWQKHLNIG